VDDTSVARSARPDETRECRSCYGTGWMLADAEYDPQSGELVEEAIRCFICRGSGAVYVYGLRQGR
jgi:hypothetical protein